jgi:hypothetical protein
MMMIHCQPEAEYCRSAWDAFYDTTVTDVIKKLKPQLHPSEILRPVVP